MSWEERILATPVDSWVVEQVIVLDWYDGPRSGFCSLSRPVADFEFELVDEEHNPNGVDVRVLRLKELPTGEVNHLTLDLQRLVLGQATKPVWSPVWKFPTVTADMEANKRVDALKRQARDTALLVATCDMIHIAKCWKAHRTIGALS